MGFPFFTVLLAAAIAGFAILAFFAGWAISDRRTQAELASWRDFFAHHKNLGELQALLAQLPAQASLPPGHSLLLAELAGHMAEAQARWGRADWPPEIPLGVLTEEFGEVGKEVMNQMPHRRRHADPVNYRRELFQLASTALRMIEAFDRRRRRPWGLLERLWFTIRYRR